MTADVRFVDLPPITVQDDTDLYAVSKNGSGSYKETAAQLKTRLGSDFLQIANNLDDLENRETAVTNLGYGSQSIGIILDADYPGGVHVLTNPCPAIIEATSNAPGNVIQLPPAQDTPSYNAFGLLQGILFIVPEGSDSIDIKTISGTLIATVDAGGQARVILTDNSTVSGGWLNLQMPAASLQTVTGSVNTSLADAPTANQVMKAVDDATSVWAAEGVQVATGNTQGANALSFGTNAGATSQGAFAVAIGNQAGASSQAIGAVAIGNSAGTTSQAPYSVAIGFNAGNGSQGSQSVAVGNGAGQTTQGNSSVAIGLNSGQTGQGVSAVAIGQQAGQTSQGLRGIAIGYQAAIGGQLSDAIAIGTNAGGNNQPTQTVAIGYFAGTSGAASTVVGANASDGGFANATVLGNTASVGGANSVAIGYSASAANATSIAIGVNSLANNTDAISIGYNSGTGGIHSIAIGATAKTGNPEGIAIGHLAGNLIQGGGAIALGYNAGNAYPQGSNAITIGYNAGNSSSAQAANTICIGANSISTGVNATVIGASASDGGFTNAIALGNGAINTAANQAILPTGVVWSLSSLPSMSVSSEEVFVSLMGSDTTGTGTLNNPWATVAHAQANISPTPTTRYTIWMLPGFYSENISLAANVFIGSSSPVETRLLGTIDINNASWNVNADNRSGFFNIELRGAISFDCSAQTNNAQGKIYCWNARFSNAPVIKAQNSVNQFIFQECYFFSGITSEGGTTQAANCYNAGGAYSIHSSTIGTGVGGDFQVVGGANDGNYSCTWAANDHTTMEIEGVGFNAATTITNTSSTPANSTITINRGSMPDNSHITNTGTILVTGGIDIGTSRSYVSRNTPAFSTSYTPSTTNDTSVAVICTYTNIATQNSSISITVAGTTILKQVDSSVVTGNEMCFNFVVPVGQSYQVVNSGSGSQTLNTIQELLL
jgi:hypothetical protein